MHKFNSASNCIKVQRGSALIYLSSQILRYRLPGQSLGALRVTAMNLSDTVLSGAQLAHYCRVLLIPIFGPDELDGILEGRRSRHWTRPYFWSKITDELIARGTGDSNRPRGT